LQPLSEQFELDTRAGKPAKDPSATIWRWLQYAMVALAFGFLYLPIVLLVILSFNESHSFGLPLKGFTLQWYREVLGNAAIMTSLKNSLILGCASAAISVALALTLALGFRANFPFKGLLLQTVLVPIVVPGVVGGVVLLLAFGYVGLPFGLFSTVLIAHVNWCLPFAFLTLYPRLHNFDKGIEEAARDLGASSATVFWRIILPIVRPGIIATLLFSFTLSFDEFVRTIFVIGSESTLPIRLWAIVTEQAQPFLPALGVLTMFITIFISLVGQAIAAKSATRNGSMKSQ